MQARSEFIHKLKMHFAAFAICIMAVIAVALGARAQLAAPDDLIALTPEIVGNYVAGYPKVKDRLDALSEELGTSDSDFSADNMAAKSAHEAARNDLNLIVAEYGFENYADWVTTTSSIIVAYTFVREGGGLDDQMQSFLDQIQNNPDMTDEQKQTMIDQMSGPMQAINANRPDQASLDAVAPYTSELDDLFGDT